MIPQIPSWPDLDITNVFYYLWSWFVAVWNWSGSSYFVFANERISYRNVLAAGLVVAVMFRAFGHITGFERDQEASIAEAQERFDRYG